jgi:hypothetical protein
MTDDEFTQLTVDYIAATEARLAWIRADQLNQAGSLDTYRELADREWELGLAWDEEKHQHRP